jgi:hypothetical protein
MVRVHAAFNQSVVHRRAGVEVLVQRRLPKADPAGDLGQVQRRDPLLVITASAASRISSRRFAPGADRQRPPRHRRIRRGPGHSVRTTGASRLRTTGAFRRIRRPGRRRSGDRHLRLLRSNKAFAIAGRSCFSARKTISGRAANTPEISSTMSNHPTGRPEIGNTVPSPFRDPVPFHPENPIEPAKPDTWVLLAVLQSPRMWLALPLK